MAAYDAIDIYCELIALRMPLIESQKYCFLLPDFTLSQHVMLLLLGKQTFLYLNVRDVSKFQTHLRFVFC